MKLPPLYNVEELQQVDITSEPRLSNYLAYMADNVKFTRMEEGRKVTRFVEEWLAANPAKAEAAPEAVTQLQVAVAENRWVGLPMCEPEQVLELFQNHVGVLWKLEEKYQLEEFSVIEQLLTEGVRAHILTIFNFDDRDAHKKQLNKVLTSNEEVLTKAEFFRGIK